MRRTLTSLRAPASSLRATPSVSPRALLSSTRPSSLPRKPHDASAQRTARRSSTSSGSAAPRAPPPHDDEPNARVGSAREPAHASDEKSKPPALPFSSDVFWSADALAPDRPPEGALPPREIFDEVLNNLLVALRPQIQQRAAHKGAPEPSLHLYCPLEGGEYVVDETVCELARRADADVVVLDGAHLAAGAHGHYGLAGALVGFDNANPLHFASRAPPQRSREDEDEGEDGEGAMPMGMGGMGGVVGVPHMMLQVIPSGKPRPQASSAAAASSGQRIFFDSLVNMAFPDASTPAESEALSRAPRIIYVRDFPTIAGSSSSWYPALESAVRARRQKTGGAVVVVFGSTPSVTTLAHSASTAPSKPGPRGVHSDLVLRREPSAPSPSGAGAGGAPSTEKEKRQEDEDEAAEKARERRLRERLRRWERGTAALANDIPRLSTDDAPGPSARGGSGSINIRDLASLLPPFVSRSGQSSAGSSGESESGFFRTSVLVPETRTPAREKEVRMARRREINGLTLRMAVGAIGGVLPAAYEAPEVEEADEAEEADEMWASWGRHLRSWAAVQRIADQSLGAALRRQDEDAASAGSSVVPVLWDDVRAAWAEQRTFAEVRRGWVRGAGKEDADAEGGAGAKAAQEDDPLVDEVRADPDLDAHTQRLLGCIVDRAAMRTTFAQVHLPHATVDAVRTMASLPLLHPDAFAHGVLREHGMTGCLLFGPPGTGKTLVVRALAKEAGTRMLAIAPSDVMDMYVGEGEKLVKAVFALARRLAPCIVFLDELDALFGARSGSRESGGAMAHRGVLTEFMQEMDGLRSASSSAGVVVIGATNRPFDLDDAVLRRLPRRLLVDLPGEEERAAIIRILLDGEILAPDVDVAQLAKDTLSFSGSDLKHLVVAAALDAVKESVDLPWDQAAPAADRADPVSPTPKIDTPPPSGHGNVAASTSNEASETDTPPDVDSAATASSVDANDSPSASIDTPAAPAPVAPSLNDPAPSPASDADSASAGSAPATPQRVLYARHFARALKEITPSASEHLGTLADLRKWNDEFGDGASSRRRRKTAVWGKDRFGFTNRWGKEADGKVADGRAER